MTQDKKNERLLPEAIIDLLVEDIIESSDENILEEARIKYGNAPAEAERIRSLIASAIIRAKKEQFLLAKKELNASRSAKSENQILNFSLDTKKALINKAKEHTPSLTLAARNGEELTENDANCFLQDLIDLGVLDKDGNLK